MPIDLSKIPGRLKEAVSVGSLVPFIAAGVSRHAETKDGAKSSGVFPTWSELIKDLARFAEGMGEIDPEEQKEIEKLVDRGKYLMAAQALKYRLGDAMIEDQIGKRFMPRDVRPGVIHQRLFDLKCPLIVTTNYDMLLEDAYCEKFMKQAYPLSSRDSHQVQEFLQQGLNWSKTDRPLIFKIHGTAMSPSKVVFTEMDYRRLLYREPGYRTVLSAIFVTRVVLMLGFSASDPEIMLMIESIRESLKHRSSPDYIVLPRGEKGRVEKKRLREDFGLEIIEYDPSDGHPELRELVEYLVTFVPA